MIDAGVVTVEAAASLVASSTRRQQTEEKIEAEGKRDVAIALMPLVSGKDRQMERTPEVKWVQPDLGSQPRTQLSDTEGDKADESQPSRIQTAAAAGGSHVHGSRGEAKEKDRGSTTTAIIGGSTNNVFSTEAAAETGDMQAAAVRAGAANEEIKVKSEGRRRSATSEGIRIRSMVDAVDAATATETSKGRKPRKRRHSFSFTNWKASSNGAGFWLRGRSSRRGNASSTRSGPKTKEETSEEAEIEMGREEAQVVWDRVMQGDERAESDTKRLTTEVAKPEKGKSARR